MHFDGFVFRVLHGLGTMANLCAPPLIFHSLVFTQKKTKEKLLKTPRIENPATWNTTPKWEFQKSAGGAAGTGADKNGGGGRSACTA